MWFAWEHRRTIAKIIVGLMPVFLLPVVFIAMLPTIIFNGLNAGYETPVLNNDIAIHGNIEAARDIIQEYLQESHSRKESEIQGIISRFAENHGGFIIPAFNDALYFDAFLIISQYCAYKAIEYDEINLDDLEKTLKESNHNLYGYYEETEIEYEQVEVEDEDGEIEIIEVEITVHTYYMDYLGDYLFGMDIFDLSDDQLQLANLYAQNLMLFLYGNTFMTGGYAQVSEDVLFYEDLIIYYATLYGIPEFVEVIKAIMMQESGGRGLDVMQSSECAYNLDYPKKPNGITDPEYSINAGVHYFADCLRIAGCSSPSDIAKLSLALQGYNFGSGYITWALKNYGGYSETNAKEFSNKMKAQYGWTVYGDPLYVAHVLRYYVYDSGGGMDGWGSPFIGRDWRKAVTSEFGYRTDPITGETKYHEGIDIAFPLGTPINAVRGGTVTAAVKASSGYGYYIIIDHGDGTTALYGHCSELLVTREQTVTIGQVIAKVGSTGRSTGNHLHLTIKLNGTEVNPRYYIK